MDSSEILEIVRDLNAAFYGDGSAYPEHWEVLPFSFISDGSTCRVEFMGVSLWDTEDDDRKTLEDGEPEALDDYLITQVHKYFVQLTTLIAGKKG